MSRNRKTAKSVVELNRSAPSAVAVAARMQSGAGAHGKSGKGRDRRDVRSRSSVKSDLRRDY